MYLLAATRAASSASDETFSFSHEARCTQWGKVSASARFMPASKMRILASGTPRQKRDLG